MAAFVTGTLTFFQQTSAPVGWTKQTTNDNYTLRVVSGSGSTSINNSVNFTTAMADVTFQATASASLGSTSFDDADLPSHTHTFSQQLFGGATPHGAKPTLSPGSWNSGTIALTNAFDFNTTGTGAHGHGISGTVGASTGGPGLFAVKYVDFILASRN